MGTYVNPGNENYSSDVRSDIYIDKTGLLRVLNDHIGKDSRYFAVSRARRFGKSQACGMLEAYYSVGCESRELFAPFEIARDPSFSEHLNKYYVLSFDVSTWWGAAKSPEDIIPLMDSRLLDEMKEEFPYLNEYTSINTPVAMNLVFKKENRQFIVIIDEYDCIIRDSAENEDLILDYLKYLRGFFKTKESKQFLALGYITGILPIKKIRGESALNNFREYTMTNPGEMVTCFGFTQKEVDDRCAEYHENPQLMRDWYDGYYMYAPVSGDSREKGEEEAHENIRMIEMKPMRLWHIYNPNSVVNALERKMFSSYWKNTGAFESLQDFIKLNYAGLKDDIVHILAGERRPVDISGFKNDLTHFETRDDVLACLIHMGYLGYDAFTKETFIPNREVAEVFESAVKMKEWNDVRDALTHSDELMRAVYKGEEEHVARVIASSQQNYSSIIHLHDENSLALAIMMSFYTARANYHVFRELPAGRGFADIVFIPKREGEYPPMIVELKWNRSAQTAIRQIKNNEYTGALTDCGGEILLVGINYTRRKSKGGTGEEPASVPCGKYTCRIERWENHGDVPAEKAG